MRIISYINPAFLQEETLTKLTLFMRVTCLSARKASVVLIKSTGNDENFN